ncbi:iron ABC transporter, ATP-binding protein [Deferribacter desulfuricans SSM1]|uniref:Iron ABC transporter, ATP-binding protein n=1 Tax=Deferribacter desulfuricans (strain DSM 14783 / JCM 11476 / NBRC 101012 / SSM1) TaxID=639282 RepID=D3PBQ7_DEFDS|nr:ABC transporter ATP-binding protein [Deferribacter desulfuricans]BAI80030.1 iron ABC transporter, ATP-binding protein [Deferribacter desulfuricans SSM1]
MSYILKVKNLCAGYENGFSLKDINFSMKKSEFLGLIGPNGSGKSTFLKTLIGTLKKYSGEIFIQDKKIESYSRKELSRLIAYVPQKIENVEITVIDYLKLGRLPYFDNFQFFESKKDLDVINYYISFFQIENLIDKYLFQLSGGEQQIVSIASALIQEPTLLLLDEPTAHLDINHQIQIMDILKILNQEKGVSIVIVLHDLNLAAEYCDNLVLLKNGHIAASGSPEDVLNYKTIEKVYDMVVVSMKNPISNKPFVLPVSKLLMDKYKNE